MIEKLFSSLSNAVDIIFIPNASLDWIFYTLIYLVFLGAFLFGVVKSKQFERSVLSFSSIFKKNKISKLDITKEHLDLISNEVAGNESFEHQWTEFRESLRVIQYDDGMTIKDKYLNTLDSEHFFRSDSYISNALYNQYLDLVPGFLTGLGILGTFLGIVDGLEKVDVTDLLAIGTKSSQSLNDLFDGVKTCFKTSALGITLSLAFSSFLARMYRSSEELFEKNVIQIIDSYFKRHTEADSIYELIRLGKEMRESLTTTLMQLSAEIPLEIAKQLAPTFNAGFSSVVTSVAELKAPMENMGKNTSEKMGDGIGVIIDELVKKVGQTTTSQLDAVRNEFSVLTDKIQSVVMSTSSAVESLTSKMHDADKVFARVADIAQTIDSGQKNGQNVALKMEEIASTISLMGISMASNGDSFGKNIQYAKNDIEQTSMITKELTEHVKNMSIQVSSLVDGMHNVLVGAERTAQLSNNTVERYVQNTDKINNSLESLSYQASMVEKSAVEISKSIVPVEKTMEGLTLGLSSFKDTMGKLSDVGPLVSSLNGLVVKVDDYTKGFTETMGKVASATNSFSNSTQMTSTELEKVTRDFQLALVEFANIFGRITPQYDQLMTAGIVKLNGSINQLQISIQDIIDSKQDS